jgi:NAD(P)-dependent dehydrogenase (short-subunit alcohol dehydrogenase family)
MRDATETTVLVTGVTDGLGKRVVRELAAQGATVLLHGHSREHLEATREEVGGRTGNERLRSYYAAKPTWCFATPVAS